MIIKLLSIIVVIATFTLPSLASSSEELGLDDSVTRRFEHHVRDVETLGQLVKDFQKVLRKRKIEDLIKGCKDPKTLETFDGILYILHQQTEEQKEKVKEPESWTSALAAPVGIGALAMLVFKIWQF